MLLLTSAVMAAAGTALIPITCPVRIGVTPSGLPDRFRRWGRSIGPNTEGLVLAILANRPHPEQGFRTCLGVLRLFKDIDPERAELIAARAVAVSALTYKSIASIIANKLERSPRDTEDAIIEHPNLRGPGYFH